MSDKIYTLDEIKSIAAPIARQYGVAAMYLFGSYARGEATPKSDLDFRIERGRIRSLFELSAMYNDLSEGFQKDLDLLTSQNIEPEFLATIQPEEVLVYASIDRDRNIVRHILKYCDEVNTAHEDFSCSKEKFMSSSTYRNAVTMPILQIGELANHLSDEFKQTYRQIPWNEMRGIRNLMAHQYHSVDFEIIWDTSRGDISALKTFCENYLAQNND